MHTILANASWTETVAPLATRFQEKFKKNMFTLVCRAYNKITPAAAGSLLGLGDNEQENVDTLVRLGWEFDQNAGLLVPKDLEKKVVLSAAEVHGGDDRSRIDALVGIATSITGV